MEALGAVRHAGVMKLTRYWFELEGETISRLGYGVTAYGEADALELLAAAIGRPLPRVRSVIVDIDVSTLDGGHVLPNVVAPPSERGVWFPMVGYQ